MIEQKLNNVFFDRWLNGKCKRLQLLTSGKTLLEFFLFLFEKYLIIISGFESRRNLGKNFTTHTINIRKKDRIFIFFDGLVDQLGGNKMTKVYE